MWYNAFNTANSAIKVTNGKTRNCEFNHAPIFYAPVFSASAHAETAPGLH
jgi:hypothetical protein